jgi:membrane protease subunit HflC
MIGRIGAVGAVVAVLLAVLAGASLFTVSQTEQVLITQFGQPVRVITQPGLHVKTPFVQTVIPFDRRLLFYEVPGEEVILGDQRRLLVDSFTLFRITDPLKTYQAVGPLEEGINARLGSIVSSSLRRVLAGSNLLSVLSVDRGKIMATVRDQVNEEMRGFGVSIEDVRLRRADLPSGNTQAILSRMQSERERIAKQARAEGAEAAQRIKADAERDRTVLLADARAKADNLRGEGEADASRLYAQAYQQDPDFFAFWRTMQAYRSAFDGGASRLVLTPDNDFLKLLQTPPAAR